ncbi:SEC10/PgrA surface exclusion domain-containing protein [Streptococcus suis]
MKKNMQVLSGVVAAVVSTGVVTNVHAEELPQKTETQPVVEAETAKQATVTEADVTTAKAEQDTAKEAVVKQEEVVTQAQKDVDTTKEKVQQAQTELVEATELVEQATPENISKAKDAVTQAEDNVTEASQNLEDKKQAEATAQQAVKDQEANVSTAQADVNEKTQAVTEAQKDVDTAQAILDGTGQAEVIAKAEQAEKQLAESKQALATAQTELANAKQADANRQKAITEAEQALNQANQMLETKTQVANQATAQADQTAKQLAKAQEAFQKAENAKNSINTITLTSEYISALRDYALNYTEKGEEAEAILSGLSSSLRAANQYKSNPNDDPTEYDMNNLPLEVRQELSWFASDLINQIRQAFGAPRVLVTPSALAFTKAITDGYVADDWSWEDVVNPDRLGHDARAVNAAAKQFGLRTSGAEEEERGEQYYENLYSEPVSALPISLNVAKEIIYYSIVEFMFNDYEWMHAESIAGVGDDEEIYFGVGLSARTNVVSAHFIGVAGSMIQDASKFDTTELVNPSSTELILTEYDVAQADFERATKDNEAVQTAKTKALNEQTEAQRQATTAQITLIAAQAVPILTPQAQAKVTARQEAVKQAEAEQKEAQANLANLQADVKVKQANLAQAKQTLTQKQAILDKAKEQLSNEQATLSRLQATQNKAKEDVVSAKEQLATAQTVLKTAQFKLMSLEEAPTLLAQAKARLLKASTELKAKEAVLAEALEKLSGLKQDEAKASEHYQAVLKTYQEVLEAERQVKLAKEYESILRKGGQPVPVVDETGRVTGYMAAIPRVQAPVAKSTPKATPTKATKAGLPSTGEQSSVLLPMLGLVGLFGLATTRRKKQP